MSQYCRHPGLAVGFGRDSSSGMTWLHEMRRAETRAQEWCSMRNVKRTRREEAALGEAKRRFRAPARGGGRRPRTRREDGRARNGG